MTSKEFIQVDNYIIRVSVISFIKKNTYKRRILYTY